MNDKISVIVTCYNHEKYVEECLRSIFSQTHQNIELLVYNDGSTDGSGTVISRVLDDSPFAETHYFSAENQGVIVVRNQALEQISGDFVFFMDSDNFLNPEHLEILLSNLTEKNADIAYTQIWDFEAEKNVLQEDLEFSPEKEFQGNLIEMASLVRHEKIAAVKFDSALKNLEDYDFWLNLIVNQKAKPIFVKETKLNYRVLDDSRSSRGNWQQYYDSYFHIIEKYRQQEPDLVHQALKKNLLMWTENYQKLELENQEQQQVIANQNQIIADKDAHIATQAEISQQALHDKDVALHDKDVQLDTIVNSKAFKLGTKLLHPFRK